MSDSDTKDEPNPGEEKKFWVDCAKTGRAGCKKCKLKIDADTVRVAKMGYNPFGGGMLKQWHHIDCILEVFKKQRATTAKIEKVDDMGGWDDLTAEEQEEVLSRFPESLRESNKDREVPEKKDSSSPKKKSKTPKKKPKSSEPESQEDETPSSSKKPKTEAKSADKKSKETESKSADKSKEKERKQDNGKSSALNERDVKFAEKDNSFREFRKLCAEIAEIPSYTSKTEAVKEFFQKGTGKGSKPLSLWDTDVHNGFIKRISDHDINSLALEIISTTVMNTYITCPNRCFKSLGVKLPYICFLVKNLNKFFSFEVQVVDSTSTKRRLRFSNYHSCCKITPFIVTFPLCLIAGWNELKINLEDFVNKSYNTIYIETIQIKVHANCRLRRIYFADKLYNDRDIPAEYKLFRKDESSLLKTNPSLPDFPDAVSDFGESEDMDEDEVGQGDSLRGNSADQLEMPAAEADGGEEVLETAESEKAIEDGEAQDE